MRFIDGGPVLPTELLNARDEGQVIFFCGSGVSRARSGLPDFYGLADSVLDGLRASATSRARAVIDAARKVRVDGVEGLIPADRAFSLLEQEFDVPRVRTAVAHSLKPKFDDLSAHRALVDLARGTDGEVRLVTTNFERLFEDSSPGVVCHAPPDLPHPNRPAAFKGIIHLHGVLDEHGAAPDDEAFVLSSADFGRAYLSDGWATRFIRSLMERYQIIFVGYTANDPPVQYLLEALNVRSAHFQPMYAFQAGDDDFAQALWAHKGVQPIAFDPANNYSALWDTLFAWAERARDPRAWEDAHLTSAAAGPRKLAPYQRGIVAHIASHPAGARKIAKIGAALPAEWLCVFDSSMRFQKPVAHSLIEENEIFDPFVAWGLDDDLVPAPVDAKNRYQERPIPAEALNVFAANRLDENKADNQAGLGLYGGCVMPLPARLRSLADWLIAIAHEPASLWWAAGKPKLHPFLAEWLPRALDREPGRFPEPVRRGWRELLETQQDIEDPHDLALYGLNETVKADGWSPQLVRRLAALRTPRLVPRRNWALAAPPSTEAPDGAVVRDVHYREADIKFDIPDELKGAYVRELGHALERAVDLELERYPEIIMLGPLRRDDEDENEIGGGGDGLTGLLREWVATLEAIVDVQPDFVRSQIGRWAYRTDAVASRLRIWESGVKGLLSDSDAAALLISLDDDGFWERDHQRDLLLTLSVRWEAFDPADRLKLGERIRRGPATYEGEEPTTHAIRAAAYALDRLHWLNSHGCTFDFNIEAEMVRLRESYPEWRDGAGEAAADSTEPKVFEVQELTEYSELIDTPIANIATTALTLDHQRIDIGTVRRSFRGLAKDRPVRALAALRRAPSPASPRLWEEFLLGEERTKELSRLASATACVLSHLEVSDLAEIARPVARWLERSDKKLSEEAPETASLLWDRLLTALEEHPAKAGSAIVISGRERDWVLEAINAASGILAGAAVHAAGRDRMGGSGPLPQRWIDALQRLLSIRGDAGRYALVVASQHINFLHSQAPTFANEYLLSARVRGDDDRAAFWSGVFRPRRLTADLHLILRDDLMKAARETSGGRGETEPLAALLLTGWADPRLRAAGNSISSSDISETILDSGEDFRRRLLFTVRTWSKGEDWHLLASEFMRDAWPRQRAVRSAAIADTIASMIVDADDRFAEMFAVAGDLLEPLPGMSLRWGFDKQKLLSLAERFPADFLEFLTRILPDDTSHWPLGFEMLLEAIEASDVGRDSRLQELRRRWSARG